MNPKLTVHITNGPVKQVTHQEKFLVSVNDFQNFIVLWTKYKLQKYRSSI